LGAFVEKQIWGIDVQRNRALGDELFPREGSIHDIIKVVQRIPVMIVLDGRVGACDSIDLTFLNVRFQFGNQFHNGFMDMSLPGRGSCNSICADQCIGRPVCEIRSGVRHTLDLLGHETHAPESNGQ
jgi:hypothetical protein